MSWLRRLADRVLLALHDQQFDAVCRRHDSRVTELEREDTAPFPLECGQSITADLSGGNLRPFAQQIGYEPSRYEAIEDRLRARRAKPTRELN